MGSIYEGIIAVHEAIHSIKVAREMGMMIKLDIKNAYDNVNRTFLFQVHLLQVEPLVDASFLVST